MGTFLQIFLTIGYLISFIVGPYTSYIFFTSISVIVPTLFVIVYFFMPETPYYYVKKNNLNAAERSLMKLRGKSSPDQVQMELFEIKSYVEANKAQEASITDLFSTPAIRKTFILAVGLIAFQQLSCMNGVLQYTQNIFDATGSNLPPEINTIIIGFVKLFSACITPFFVDRLGRRILFQISGFGMSIGLIFLGLYFYMENNGLDTSAVQFLPILSLIVYVVAFCLGE